MSDERHEHEGEVCCPECAEPWGGAKACDACDTPGPGRYAMQPWRCWTCIDRAQACEKCHQRDAVMRREFKEACR